MLNLKSIKTIHKWVGLISGIGVLVISLTGCIYCFHDEIKDLTEKHWRKVTVENHAYVLPSTLIDKASAELPHATLSYISYLGKSNSVVLYMNENKEEYRLYYNPYSGTFLKKDLINNDFFEVVLRLHRYLWLPEAIGKQVVGIITLLFVLMLLSGLVLWFPKKRSQIKKAFIIKWHAGWKRINYDGHRAVGFYVALAALIIALSGLVFSYDWMEQGIYKLAGGSAHEEEEHLPTPLALSSYETPLSPSQVLDSAFVQTTNRTPDAGMIILFPVVMNSAVTTCSYPQAHEYEEQSNFYFHPLTGTFIKASNYSTKSTALKVVESMYGIHTGSLWGLWGKILAFTTSLLVSYLTVSGILLFCVRGKKYSAKQKQ